MDTLYRPGDLVRLMHGHFLRSVDGMDIGIILYLTDEMLVTEMTEPLVIPNLVIMWQTGAIFPVPDSQVVFLSRTFK